jgi:hypothetical protein
VNTPSERPMALRTIWFVAKAEVAPRLVTAYPA